MPDDAPAFAVETFNSSHLSYYALECVFRLEAAFLWLECVAKVLLYESNTT